MEEENFTASISTRCTVGLRQSLERLAAREKRPLANYIRIVLEKHVEGEESNLHELEAEPTAA